MLKAVHRSVAAAFLFAALPLAAATPALDRLAGEIAAFAAAPGDGAASLKLSTELSRFDKLASFERDPMLRAELQARLAELRAELLSAGRAQAAGNGALAATGSISGRVTDDGAPLANARVAFYSRAGSYFGQTGTDANGFYSYDLDPGVYVAYAEPSFSSSDLSPQLYSGISCRLHDSCEPGEGTPLQLNSGGHLTADFALADLGHIKGTVRARETLEPIDGAVASLYHLDGGRYDDVPVYAGHYDFGGVEPGEYLVVISSYGDRAGMIYRDIPCRQARYDSLTCPPFSATRVAVGLEQVVEGIDFDLYRGAKLSGRIVDARTGAGLPYSRIYLLLSPYESLDHYETDYDGFFEIGGLFTGTYYLQAEASHYTTQLFDRHDCTGEVHCLAGARPIPVDLGESYSGFDFRLVPRGTLAGRIVDARTGLGIAGADVRAGARQGDLEYFHAYTDVAGFFSISDLPAVDLVVQAEHRQYLGEFFDDVDFRLGPATATSIRIEPGEVESLEMALAPRGRLRGRVYAAATGQPIAFCRVQLVPVEGPNDVQLADCDAAGVFVANDLLPGTYFAVAYDFSFANYLYGKGSCNEIPGFGTCKYTDGQPVVVRSGEETGPLDFPLEQGASLAGQVVFDTFEFGPTAQVRLYEEDGDEVRPRSVFGPYADFGFGKLAAGSYRLVVDGGEEWESLAWPGAPCSRWYCNPRLAQPIDLAAGEELDEIDFQISPLAPYAGCTPSSTALCLNQGRYRVKATWRDFGGATGAGSAGTLTADTGYFYFFSPDNLEVMIKALDGCEPRLGHHFWIYAAGLTNVAVELQVEDTLTGAFRYYSNALGNTFQPILDSGAFATCDAVEPRVAAGEAAAAPAPAVAPKTSSVGGVPDVPGQSTDGGGYCQQKPGFELCFASRFVATVRYRTPGGNEGSGVGLPITDNTGAYSFFDPSNLELVVKLLDACSTDLPGYWVFVSGLTDVAVDLQIQDLATGRVKLYQSGPGPFAPILDLGAFPCD